MAWHHKIDRIGSTAKPASHCASFVGRNAQMGIEVFWRESDSELIGSLRCFVWMNVLHDATIQLERLHGTWWRDSELCALRDTLVDCDVFGCFHHDEVTPAASKAFRKWLSVLMGHIDSNDAHCCGGALVV
jgi:hypothetical protein